MEQAQKYIAEGYRVVVDLDLEKFFDRVNHDRLKSLTRFITAKLKLTVNEQKSAVARPWERKFLGFGFTRAETPKRRIAPKAVLRFKGRVRELTSRTRGVSVEKMAEELAATCEAGSATSAYVDCRAIPICDVPE